MKPGEERWMLTAERVERALTDSPEGQAFREYAIATNRAAIAVGKTLEMTVFPALLNLFASFGKAMEQFAEEHPEEYRLLREAGRKALADRNRTMCTHRVFATPESFRSTPVNIPADVRWPAPLRQQLPATRSNLAPVYLAEYYAWREELGLDECLSVECFGFEGVG